MVKVVFWEYVTVSRSQEIDVPVSFFPDEDDTDDTDERLLDYISENLGDWTHEEVDHYLDSGWDVNE